jgi:hypothetical protein
MGDARKLPFESGQRLLVHPHGFSQPLVLANQIARLLFLDVLDVAASVLGLRSWDIRDCGTELPEFGKRVNDDLDSLAPPSIGPFCFLTNAAETVPWRYCAKQHVQNSAHGQMASRTTNRDSLHGCALDIHTSRHADGRNLAGFIGSLRVFSPISC